MAGMMGGAPVQQATQPAAVPGGQVGGLDAQRAQILQFVLQDPALMQAIMQALASTPSATQPQGPSPESILFG